MKGIRSWFRQGNSSAVKPDSSFLERDVFAEDIECSLVSFSHASACEILFLNRYDDRALFAYLRDTGFAARLSGLGFKELFIDIDRDDNQIHSFRVYHARRSPERLLMELRLSERTFAPGTKGKKGKDVPAPFDALILEWVTIQNPRAKFSRRRPRLPGQESPGIGGTPHLFRLLELIARNLSKDGVVTVPEHFHNAVLYAKRFRFADPGAEGVFQALTRDLAAFTLPETAWGIESGAVLDRKTGASFAYSPHRQVMPLSPRLAGFFESARYAEAVDQIRKESSFVMDVEKLKKAAGKKI